MHKYSSANIVHFTTKTLFLQKFEVFVGFAYLLAIEFIELRLLSLDINYVQWRSQNGTIFTHTQEKS